MFLYQYLFVFPSFLDAIASPSSYPCQSVSQWVIHSFIFGDSYRIFELCELVRPELAIFVDWAWFTSRSYQIFQIIKVHHYMMIRKSTRLLIVWARGYEVLVLSVTFWEILTFRQEIIKLTINTSSTPLHMLAHTIELFEKLFSTLLQIFHSICWTPFSRLAPSRGRKKELFSICKLLQTELKFRSACRLCCMEISIGWVGYSNDLQ